jgi:hypothetical protein
MKRHALDLIFTRAIKNKPKDFIFVDVRLWSIRISLKNELEHNPSFCLYEHINWMYEMVKFQTLFTENKEFEGSVLNTTDFSRCNTSRAILILSAFTIHAGLYSRYVHIIWREIFHCDKSNFESLTKKLRLCFWLIFMFRKKDKYSFWTIVIKYGLYIWLVDNFSKTWTYYLWFIYISFTSIDLFFVRSCSSI